MSEYIKEIKLPDYVEFILSRLSQDGYEAYVVGGCVRDSLLGKEPKDWDVTTNALPEQIKDCFIGFRIIETGIKHGTVTVVILGESYEITTYRIDGEYSDSRHPNSVEFTDLLEDDLSRRDFTMNAMAYNPERGLVDPFNGVKDIGDGRIRCVGDASKRLQEDALRIMRAVRFASTYKFFIEHSTFMAMRQNKHRLKDVSVERIRTEFDKLLCGSNVENALMCNIDLIMVFIPEVLEMFGFEQHNPYHQYDVWEHTRWAIQYAPENNLIVRLTMFFHDIGKPKCFSIDANGRGHFYGHSVESAAIADEVMKRLKYDNKTRNMVRELVYHHDLRLSPSAKFIKRQLNKHGEDFMRHLLLVRQADILAQHHDYYAERIQKKDEVERILNEVIEQQQCFSIKDLEINGHDLIDIGFEEGKRIGELLQGCVDLIIDDVLPNDRCTLLCLLRSVKRSDENKKLINEMRLPI